MTISNTKCQKNSDCSTNVCELIYENNKPIGRFCLEDNNKYTIDCKFDKDCDSGKCEKIYDNDGRMIGKKCMAPPDVEKDGVFNSLFGETRAENKHGLISNEAIQNEVLIGLGEEGPISEMIIMVLNLLGDIFGILVYDFKKQANDKDQGLMFSIWYTIFNSIFYNITRNSTDGLIWAQIQLKTYDKRTKKCKSNSTGIDMWYVRTLITVLCPPFGVFLAKGVNGIVYIMISCLLTFAGYFPGLIYSFAVINSSEAELNEMYSLKKFQ